MGVYPPMSVVEQSTAPTCPPRTGSPVHGREAIGPMDMARPPARPALPPARGAGDHKVLRMVLIGLLWIALGIAAALWMR